MLLLNYQIVPRHSRIKQYKVILNSHDVQSLFKLWEFIEYFFGTTDNTQVQKKLSNLNPRILFKGFLRYLISKFESQKTLLYRNLSVSKDSTKSKYPLKMLNIFNRFEQNTNIGISKFLATVTKQITIVYQCVKKLAGKYWIVTVSKNDRLKLFMVMFYNPFSCRQQIIN